MDFPSQPTVGSRLNVRLACLTLAFFRALTEYAVARPYAIELTADLTGSFYKKWRALRRFVETRDPLKNLDSLPVGDIVPLAFPFDPSGDVVHLSRTPEARLEREDRHASRWAPVRTSR